MDKIELIKEYLKVQACDTALWAIPKTHEEAHVKYELRKLICMIENMSNDEITEEIRRARVVMIGIDVTIN